VPFLLSTAKSTMCLCACLSIKSILVGSPLTNKTGHFLFRFFTSFWCLITRFSVQIFILQTLENMSPGNYTIRVAGFSDRALQGQIFSNDTEIFFDGKQVSTFIQTSKPFYRQGQTVRFRVIPVQHNLLPVSTTMDVRIMVSGSKHC